MDKLKLHTPDHTAANVERIAAMFPNCLTEVKDEKGNLKRAIDFDLLKQELSGDLVEGPQERYRLDWPGKREALALANTPVALTLRPCREESVDFENTKNLYIEGDNLDALKLLQETYLGKVKMIYIDPPYNTGKDFIYDDNFSMRRDEYQEASGAVDEHGNAMFDEEKWKQNLTSNGRFHSEWLSMIYPRLKLSRNLLKDDGLLFISINDKEVHSLKKICDEVYGEANFVAQFIWNTEGNTDNQYEVKVNHEYILCYCRDNELLQSAIGRVVDPNTPEDSNLLKGYADNNINKNNPENPPGIITLPAGFPSSEQTLFYEARNIDDDFFAIANREKFISDELKERYNLDYLSGLPVKLDDLIIENGVLTKPCRVFGGVANRNKLSEFIANNCQPIDDDGSPMRFYINSNAAIRYRKHNEKPRNILSVLRNLGTTETSKTYLKKGLGLTYDYPKPLPLMEYLIEIGCEGDGIVVDFFSGSGTLAEAVMRKGLDLSGSRRWIMIQIPERIEPSKKEQKAAYDFCITKNLPPFLTEIAKERIRRSGAKIRENLESELEGKLPGTEDYDSVKKRLGAVDIGFRVLKIDSSNLKEVHHAPDELKQGQLELHTDNIKDDRTPEDLLFQVLVDWGVDFALPIATEEVAGKNVFFVDGNALAACFDPLINEDLVRELAKRKPLRAVFRDKGFGDDSMKINLEQIFKLLSPGTELKTL